MISFGEHPMFINNAVIGQPAAPQVCSFDAYYTEPIIVGIQIVGSSSDNPIVGFLAVTDPYTGVTDVSTLQDIEQNVQTDPISTIVTTDGDCC